MKLAPIIARLKTEVASFGGRVAGAAELSVLLDGESTLDLPNAFVIPFGDDSPGSNTAGAIMQALTEQVAVYVAVDPGDGRGQDGAETLVDIRAQLWAALIGWPKDDEDLAPFEYLGSEHIGLTRAELVHQYVFQTVRIIREI